MKNTYVELKELKDTLYNVLRSAEDYVIENAEELGIDEWRTHSMRSEIDFATDSVDVYDSEGDYICSIPIPVEEYNA